MECQSEKTISKSEWISEVSGKPWLTIETSNTDQISKAVQSLISEFSELLVNSISSSPCISTEETLDYLHTLNPKLPSIFQFSPNSKATDPAKDEVEEKKSSENAKPAENSSAKADDTVDIEYNLFSRIYEILSKQGRSFEEIHDSFDVSKDGKISQVEFRTGILKNDPSITNEESNAVFGILDGNSDGFISLDEISKRLKLVKEKAELEEKDPLACMVFSTPLDPLLVPGNLAVMLVKAQGLKPGTHNVKIKLPNYLEYVSPETIEANPTWNFRADFFFENASIMEMPLVVELELFNKKKLEGTGTFQWQKSMNNPNEFSLKSKVDIKTSTGQSRGFLYMQAQWTPIIVKQYSQEELDRMKILEVQAKVHRENIGKSEEDKKEDDEDLRIPHIDSMEVSQLFVEKSDNAVKPGAYIYLIKKSQRIIEQHIEADKAPSKAKRGDGGTRRTVNSMELKNHVAASKIQQIWKKKKTIS